MLNPSPLAHPAETLAEVRAHDQVMRYRRAGAGRPLVVLRGADEADALWPELDAELVSRFRVVTPDLPAECEDLAAWVTDFLEGLGLDRVAVLAADPCCLSALELALLNAGQVERLVLVPAGAVSETGLDGTLATTLAGVSVPLIVVRRGLPADVALPLLRQFLSLEARPSTVG
jgi:pimeloyl-ACP methyl ester carboxylesterase